MVYLKIFIFLICWLCSAAAQSEFATASGMATDQLKPAKKTSCVSPTDTLERVLCFGKLNIGLRTDYPPYASLKNGSFVGFEADMARQLASRLGVEPNFSIVTPANRIAMLGEGRIEVTIATMGHTQQRDKEVLFVQPYYYQSQTVVLGRKEIQLNSMDKIRGQTVCVTLGNSTNADLAAVGSRLMIFDSAPRLLDALITGRCSLVAQDDSFLAQYLQQTDFASAYNVKFGFAPLSWGIAVRRGDSEALAVQLGKALQRMHADGTTQKLAQKHGVDLPFLEAQRQLWDSGICDAATKDPACVTIPRDSGLTPTRFAPAVDRMEARIKQITGIKVTLAMLKTEIALEMFAEGIAFSLVLVLGSVVATLSFALLFGATLSSHLRAVRWPMRLLLATMQSTPLILLMVLAGVVISVFKPDSPWPVLFGAIMVLGLCNGSNAGQAISEAAFALHSQAVTDTKGEQGWTPSLFKSAQVASPQVLAFVINATRGSAAASFIGVPELLSASTDIASFSSERITTYTLLLIFYMLVVAAVAHVANRCRLRLQRAAHA